MSPKACLHKPKCHALVRSRRSSTSVQAPSENHLCTLHGWAVPLPGQHGLLGQGRAQSWVGALGLLHREDGLLDDELLQWVDASSQHTQNLEWRVSFRAPGESQGT